MDFSPPAILPPAAAVTLLSAVTSATSSGIQTRGTNYPSLHEALTLQVTGTNWRGTIIVEGRIGGLDWVQLPLTGQFGHSLQQATSNGLYYCNISGVTSYRVRTTSFAGAGNVTVTGLTGMAFAERVDQRRLNDRVAQAYQITVAAGATTAIFSGVDVSGYAMLSFGFRGKDSEITGAWRAQMLYAPQHNRDLGGSASNGNSYEPSITVVDTLLGRAQSDFFFPKAELATASIKNFDTVDHIFDAKIVGMR